MNIDNLIKKAREEKISLNLIFKEYLHSVILDYFFRKGLFDTLVFQGGTAIRFFYQGVRYSEDLDFVIKGEKKKSFSPDNIRRKLESISSYIEKTIPIVKNSKFKIQKEEELIGRYLLSSEIEVLNINDRTRIEIGFVPSYTDKVYFLYNEYLTFPPVVIVESAKEILSDKIVAFGGRNYLKGRDIWDIYFLSDTVHLKIDENTREMVEKKISDYRLEKSRFLKKLKENLDILKERGEEILNIEMRRFLPYRYQKMFRNQYKDICNRVGEIFKDLK